MDSPTIRASSVSVCATIQRVYWKDRRTVTFTYLGAVVTSTYVEAHAYSLDVYRLASIDWLCVRHVGTG